MNLTNKNGDISLGSLYEAVQQVEDATSVSLFQYARRTMIMSRVYIGDSLSHEDVLSPLMMNLMNLYSGLILTAMDLNRHVHGAKKIRDALSVVATESMEPAVMALESMQDFFKTQIPGLEEIAKDYSIATTAPKEDVPLPSGRIIEVKFGTAGRDEDTNEREAAKSMFSINLFLQLQPMFIPGDVMSQFISMNFTPTVRQRYMQSSAGEISFFKDFLFGQDLRKKRLQALKKDKSGVLKSMVDKQENDISNVWLKFAQVTPDRQNIANTILIVNKPEFEKACSAAGMRFNNYDSRQKFFNKTFTMMLCAVDPMYNTVEIYYHGLKAVSQFSFDQLKKNAKTEAADLMTIMKDYSKNLAPKF